jgi:hypothetical protein
MLRKFVSFFAFAVCLSLSWRAMSAQEVVHALTGTVSSIDAAGKTITVFLDGGTQGVFKDMTSTKVSLSVDKKLLADATNVDDFKKSGAYAVVFYFGGIDERTAVALRSLGSGPFTAASGTIEGFEAHQSITLRDSSGAMQTFKLTADTVAESGSGAVTGLKFQAQKGDRARVVGMVKDGALTALFVRSM